MSCIDIFIWLHGLDILRQWRVDIIYSNQNDILEACQAMMN